jgi:mono/diheme cytochrome c family protein
MQIAPSSRCLEVPMRKPVPVLIVLLLSFLAAAQSAKPAPRTSYYPVPVTAAREPNPVPATPESIAEGKKIYSYDCAQCHGATGDGKTDAGKDLKIPDFTDPAALKDRTDGALFYIVKSGHGDMPREGNRVKTGQLWDLVNYIRTFARKPPAEPTPSK